MDIMDRVDPIRIGEEIIYTIFHHIFHDEGARKHFTFSQINFFNNKDGLPGWNIWLEDKKGAYQLVLAGADETAEDNGLQGLVRVDASSSESTVEGRFLIRYFPDTDDSVLERFSGAESLIRFGAEFDDTGTPSLSGQNNIEDSYFVVGFLDFKTTIGRDFVELKCVAPNRWKDVRLDGLYLDVSAHDRYEVVKPGAVDRDVPGWELVSDLFEKLTAAFGYVHQAIPVGAVFGQRKWVRFEIQDNVCCEKSDPDVDLFQLVIGFNIKSGCRECQCEQPGLSESYLEKVKDRLVSDGFMVVDDALDGKDWLFAGRMKFSSDIESEMTHCCYHDH